ncbi:MAG: mechanosensitive ion channel family protein [Rubellimicrobium sp.]|nr:mechanosensitive ion channel family protein [Rubellimicrobium sp.]
MIRAPFLIPALLAVLAVLAPGSGPAFAQDDQPPAPAEAPAESAGESSEDMAPDIVIGDVDYAAWQRTAERSATISENASGSTFALERLRNDLVQWRDRFLSVQGQNAARIATVRQQLAALGEAPADPALEDLRVSVRRALLMAELNRLRAPALLAQEAYAQSNGLIAEIDTLLRARRTASMTTRGESPLNPAQWAPVASDLGRLVSNLWKEARVTFTSVSRLAVLTAHLGQVMFYTLLGLVLLARGRRWMGQLAHLAPAQGWRGVGVWSLVLSLGQIVLPFLGLSALVEAVQVSGMAGFRLTQVIREIPQAGAFLIVARWLGERMFGPDARVPLATLLDDARRRRAWRHAVLLGAFGTAGAMILALLAAGEIAPVTATSALFPVQILLSVVLFRLGRVVLSARLPEGDSALADGTAEATVFQRGLLSVVGRALVAVAVIGPVLTALGYGAAGEALVNPAVRTLGLIGVVMVLQTFAYDLHALVTRSEDGSRDALLPVIVAVVLTLAALPVLALVWGVRTEDLREIWARFQEGFAMGETRISPTDFLAFVVIFAIGFAMTRLLQGVLRTAILPKTRLDPGGRSAIVSGTGYVGIFVAGLVAITSVGLDLSNLAIVAGALSVGIGFGLQNIVSNFISGIILLIERPISAGDWIEVGGKMGYVRDISVRSTRIETFDRTNVIVPNADLISGQVTNWTRGSSVGRIIVPVSVMFGSDIPRVMAILREIAEGHPMVLLNPPPSVVLQNFAPDLLNFEIRAIVRDVNFGLAVRSEMNIDIARRFHDEGIEFAGAPRPNAGAGRTAASPAPGPAEMRVTLLREGAEGAGTAGNHGAGNHGAGGE